MKPSDTLFVCLIAASCSSVVLSSFEALRPDEADLLCICGKGGVCIDRSVVDVDSLLMKPFHLSREFCRCDLVSPGIYMNCTKLIDHCKFSKCRGSCFPAFGGSSCECSSYAMGPNCDEERVVEKIVEFPMAFQFLQMTAKEPKKLYLIVQKFGDGFKATLNSLDRGENFTYTKSDFKFAGMLEICVNEYFKYPHVHDLEVCEFFMAKDKFLTLTPSFSRRPYSLSDPGDAHRMSFVILNQGLLSYEGIVPFFTPFYGVGTGERKSCEYKIVFRGCGKYFNTRQNYYVTDAITVEAIKIPLNPCKSIRQRASYWRYYPNDSNVYIEEKGTNNYFKVFQPFTFKSGLRRIEYHDVQIGHEVHYGFSRQYANSGKCLINVLRAPSQLYIVGGTYRQYPCFAPLYLETASTIPAIPAEQFILEWSCEDASGGKQIDDFCQPTESHGKSFVYEDLPCDVTFIFTVKMVNPDFTNASASQKISLLRGAPVFYIKCLYNCVHTFKDANPLVFSYFINVMIDETPKWRLFVNNEEVTVRNITDAHVLYIPDPPTSAENSTIIRVECSSWRNSYAGHCRADAAIVQLFEPFHVFCPQMTDEVQIDQTFRDHDSTELIYDLLLVEDFSGEYPLFYEYEPVAEANSPLLFNVNVKLRNSKVLICDGNLYDRSSEPLYTLKIETVVREVTFDKVNVLTGSLADIKQLISTNDFYQALITISRVTLIVNEITDESKPFQRINADNARLVIAQFMTQMDTPKTLLEVARFLFAVFRLSTNREYGGELVVNEEGNRHLIMRLLSGISRRVMESFTPQMISEMSESIKTRVTSFKSAITALTKLLTMPEPEFQFRRVKPNDRYAYFHYYCRDAGEIILPLFETLREVIPSNALYVRPIHFESEDVQIWIHSDELHVIHETILEYYDQTRKNRGKYVPVDFVISWNGDNQSTFHFHTVTLTSKAFWWLSDKDIVSRILSASLTSTESGRRIEQPNNVIFFQTVPLSDFTFWRQEPVLRGRSLLPKKNASEATKDRALTVWQIKIRRPAAGKVFIYQNNERMKVYCAMEVFPSYSDVFDSLIYEPNTIHRVDFNAISEEDTDSLYVAVLPENEKARSVHYELHLVGLVCLTYSSREWKPGECALESDMTRTIQCRCPRITWNAVERVPLTARQVLSDFNYAVPRAPQDVLVFVNVIVGILFFIGLLVWARAWDKREVNMNVLRLLDSYEVDCKYFFLVAVHTGTKVGSGSNSSVGIRMIGKRGSYGPHLLRYRMTSARLSTGREDWFLIESQKYAGELKGLELWNDFTGTLVDWYCERILVFDITATMVYDFVIRRWLAQSDHANWLTYEMNALASVVEPAAESRRETKATSLRLYLINQLFESHRWISLIFKSPRNIYSRMDRTFILMNFFFVVMSTSMILKKSFAVKGDLDATELEFQSDEVSVVAMSLASAYAVYIVDIFLFEKQYENTKRNKPTNADIFPRILISNTVARPTRRMARSRLQKSTRTGRILRFIIGLNRYILYHLYSPSNYYVWFDPTDIRKAARPKILVWTIAWRVMSLTTLSLSVAYLSRYGFSTGTVESQQWMMIYGVALAFDAILVDPIRIFVKSACLFYFNDRRSWDNFYVQGMGVLDWDKKLWNYYTEIHEKTARKKKFQVLVTKFRVLGRAALASPWFTFVTGVGLLAIFSEITLLRNTKAIWCKVKGLHDGVEEPRVFFDVGLKDVRNQRQFFQYFIRTLLPNLHRFTWYNGKQLTLTSQIYDHGEVNVSDSWSVDEFRRGWTIDLYSKVVGILILVQNRVIPYESMSPKIMRPFMNRSGSFLSVFNHETRNFSRKWEKYEYVAQRPGTWTYSSDYGIESFMQRIIRIPVKGYVHEMPIGFGKSKRSLISLYLNDWFDRRTRELSFFINTFNPFMKVMTYLELRVTVSPECYYRGRFWLFSIEVSTDLKAVKAYISWIILMLILAILAFLRIWSIMRVRGFTNYSNESDFAVDATRAANCITTMLYCYVLILNHYLASLYTGKSYKNEYIRLSEMYSVEYMSFVLAGVFLSSVQITTVYPLLRFMSVSVSSHGYRSVMKVALGLTLLFAFICEILRGSIFLLARPPQVNVFSKAIIRERFDSFQTTASANDLYFTCVSVAGLLLKLSNLSSFVRLYRSLGLEGKPQRTKRVSLAPFAKDSVYSKRSNFRSISKSIVAEAPEKTASVETRVGSQKSKAWIFFN